MNCFADTLIMKFSLSHFWIQPKIFCFIPAKLVSLCCSILISVGGLGSVAWVGRMEIVIGIFSCHATSPRSYWPGRSAATRWSRPAGGSCELFRSLDNKSETLGALKRKFKRCGSQTPVQLFWSIAGFWMVKSFKKGENEEIKAHVLPIESTIQEQKLSKNVVGTDPGSALGFEHWRLFYQLS